MATGGTANRFELEARERKVVRIVQAVDDVASFCGLDPSTDGFAIADMIAELPEQRWFDVAGGAASQTTRDEVVKHYRERGAIAQNRVA